MSLEFIGLTLATPLIVKGYDNVMIWWSWPPMIGFRLSARAPIVVESPFRERLFDDYDGSDDFDLIFIHYDGEET